jgi:DNA-binding winged helix-turn-helix (wHTH) protein
VFEDRVSLCFGQFRFRRDARILFRQGHIVSLTPRALEFLGILLQGRPHPIARADLERRLWPHTMVAENSLSNIVLEVRRALDDQRRGTFIRTVHGLGYAFVGEVRDQTEGAAPPLGSFRALINGREIALVEGENWIGRANECRIQVASSLVSRRHACIMVRGSAVTVRDGPSRNGTFLNHKRLSGPATLRHQDQLQLGTEDMSIQIIHTDKPTDSVPISRDSAKASHTSIRETGLTLVRAPKRDG